MRTVRIDPGKEPIVFHVDNTLEELQNAVGGYIEVIRLGNNGVIALVDEEGKMKDKPITRLFFHRDGCWCDPVCGTILLCKENDEEFTSISPDEAQKLRAMFRNYSVNVK